MSFSLKLVSFSVSVLVVLAAGLPLLNLAAKVVA